MIGEISGLVCAPLWAISSILLKSQTDKLEALQINALRGIFASAFAIAIVPIFGKANEFDNLSLSSVIYLLSSIVIGMMLGDTLYIKGMGIIGVSRALPISIIYPIFVLPFSVVMIGERLSVVSISGIFITLAGLYLITASQREAGKLPEAARREKWLGMFLVFAASLCWAAGTITLNYAMTTMDPIPAGAIRMPFMTLFLFLIIYIRRRGTVKVWNYNLRSLMILSLAGILGIGLGGLLFMTGVKHAGPTKTAILSSTSPLFGVPLSILILREKLSLKIILGTILCVVGVWFVI